MTNYDAVGSFLTHLKNWTDDPKKLDRTRTRFGSEKPHTFSLTDPRMTAIIKQVVSALVPALNKMWRIKNEKGEADKSSGISTERAVDLLGALQCDGNITLVPSMFDSFYKKLANAKSFVSEDDFGEWECLSENATTSSRPPSPESSSSNRANRAEAVRTATSWLFGGGRKSRKLGNKFNRCVKSVRSTVRARKGSTKESAAIAICTTSVLHPRGRTIKRYRKKHLITQKKFRGGCGGSKGWCS